MTNEQGQAPPPMNLEPIEGFEPEQAIAELNHRFGERLKTENISPEDQAYLLGFITHFAQVATQQILQQRVIDLPQEAVEKGFKPIPYNGPTALQTLLLFCEGVYYAMLKGWKDGYPQEVHTQIVQMVAQHVFDQAKQLVISTYGQESTPELQISEEQQVAYVNQAAESALLFYVNEYEKTQGGFEPEQRLTEPERIEASEPTEESTEDTEESDEVVEPLPVAPTGPQLPEGSREEHTKYAALALFLTTLVPRQQQKVFQHFTPEEQQVMNYYASPQNIEQTLDTKAVTEHLRCLKEQIKEKNSQTVVEKRSLASLAIEDMVTRLPKELLINYVSHERPLIQNYMEASCRSKNEDKDSLESIFELEQEKELSDSSPKLSAKVEAVLHRFLVQKAN